MAEDFPFIEAVIIQLAMEAVFYGIYLVSCGFCAVSLFRYHDERKRFRDVNWIMVVVGLLLFSIASLDLSVDILIKVKAFVFSSGPGGPAAVFGDISSWENIVKVRSSLYCFLYFL